MPKVPRRRRRRETATALPGRPSSIDGCGSPMPCVLAHDQSMALECPRCATTEACATGPGTGTTTMFSSRNAVGRRSMPSCDGTWASGSGKSRAAEQQRHSWRAPDVRSCGVAGRRLPRGQRHPTRVCGEQQRCFVGRHCGSQGHLASTVGRDEAASCVCINRERADARLAQKGFRRRRGSRCSWRFERGREAIWRVALCGAWSTSLALPWDALRCRAWSRRSHAGVASFIRTMPPRMRAAAVRRRAVAGSASTVMPTRKAPTAPMPVQTV